MDSKTEIALQAKLNLRKTADALGKLEELGLARRGATNRWHPTQRAKRCRVRVVADRMRRDGDPLGPGGRRLLEALDRPMRGRELAERLGVTLQAVHVQLVRLHAQGRVRFGDREQLTLIVARSGDATLLLSAAEERVLSAVPDGYATNVTKIRVTAHIIEARARMFLERLVAAGLIAAHDGMSGDVLYRITAAGLAHPQRARDARRAEPPRLPVESERVRAVLSILCARPSRTRELSDLLSVPYLSMNALMQYLKRKRLAQKIDGDRHAPYRLTDKGRAALAEMKRRQAA
jgi:predicted transcriptional regulator